MRVDGEGIQLLGDIGFTKNQAIVYLTLLRLEEADGKMLSEKTNIARSEVYRILHVLQKKGLVEKEITTPYRFKATPADLGLQILITKRMQQCQEIQERIEDFLQNLKDHHQETPREQEYKLSMIEGKHRLTQVIKRLVDDAQRSINALTTLPRWLQILDFCFGNFEKALDRGVAFRIVLGELDSEIVSSEDSQALMKKQKFELRGSGSRLKTNAAVFDEREVTINFRPSHFLTESPLLLTDHPSFVSMCQDHFENIWKTAWECKLEN